jgi:hypothetical protein
MKIHKGPLNLSSVSMKNPVHLMQDILEVVEMLDIKFKPVRGLIVMLSLLRLRSTQQNVKRGHLNSW